MPYSESIRSDVLAGVQSCCSHPMLHSIFVRVAYALLHLFVRNDSTGRYPFSANIICFILG